MTSLDRERGAGVMNRAPLICHPDLPCAVIKGIEAGARRMPGGGLVLNYSVAGDISGLHLPAPGPSNRADGLWRQTCFEAFLGSERSPGYFEFNFAPSGEWACYRFDAYRQGMAAAAMAGPPEIVLHAGPGCLELEARLDLSRLAPAGGHGDWRLALAVVLRQADGSLSYWALAHPPGRPDFHAERGFVLKLAE